MLKTEPAWKEMAKFHEWWNHYDKAFLKQLACLFRTELEFKSILMHLCQNALNIQRLQSTWSLSTFAKNSNQYQIWWQAWKSEIEADWQNAKLKAIFYLLKIMELLMKFRMKKSVGPLSEAITVHPLLKKGKTKIVNFLVNWFWMIKLNQLEQDCHSNLLKKYILVWW